MIEENLLGGRIDPHGKGRVKELQGQFHVVSDLFTGICLSLRILSYSKTMLLYSNSIRLARSGWVTISYSIDTSSILYLAFGLGGDPGDMMTQS